MRGYCDVIDLVRFFAQATRWELSEAFSYLAACTIRRMCLEYLKRGSGRQRGQRATQPYRFYGFQVMTANEDSRASHDAFLYTSPEIEPLCLVNVAPAGAVANMVIDTAE